MPEPLRIAEQAYRQNGAATQYGTGQCRQRRGGQAFPVGIDEQPERGGGAGQTAPGCRRSAAATGSPDGNASLRRRSRPAPRSPPAGTAPAGCALRRSRPDRPSKPSSRRFGGARAAGLVTVPRHANPCDARAAIQTVASSRSRSARSRRAAMRRGRCRCRTASMSMSMDEMSAWLDVGGAAFLTRSVGPGPAFRRSGAAMIADRQCCGNGVRTDVVLSMNRRSDRRPSP